ncbi:MAG: helix-turn-helix transcriptional regulator [Nitrospirota bacterium]|nr:helix-turn-helix transcriptional regulator [Nitrospirota bacterium]
MGIIYLHFYQYPSVMLIIAVSTGGITPYILRGLRTSLMLHPSTPALQSGIAVGGVTIMALLSLQQFIPDLYLNTFISILPIGWLFSASVPNEEKNNDPNVPGQLFFLVTLTTVAFIFGIFNNCILDELSVIGGLHYVLIFTSLATGAFLTGRRSVFAILSIALSLGIFGFKASTASYIASDVFFGIGAGGIIVHAFSLISRLQNLQKGISLGLAGLGFLAGEKFAEVSRGLYNMDYEGLTFISIIVLFSGTLIVWRFGSSTAFFSQGNSGPDRTEESQPEITIDVKPRRFEEIYKLSRRETEVINLIIKGKSTREMAESLFISESTIKTHLRHIYDKAGVKNRIELLRLLNN